MSNQTDEEGVVVFITALNDENASIIAKDFVESKLAACVNIVKNILSIYLWQSKVEDDFEVPMIVNTRRT